MRKIPRRYATQEVVVNNIGAIHAVEILCSFLLAQIPPAGGVRWHRRVPPAGVFGQGEGQKKACRPVMARPKIRACTSCVPS